MDLESNSELDHANSMGRARAEIKRLREALAPFAAVADDYARSDASRATQYRDEGRSPGPDRADTHRVSILLGDCRRARTVLQN